MTPTLALEFRLGYENTGDAFADRKAELLDVLAVVARRLRPYAIGQQEYKALTDVMDGRHLSARDWVVLIRCAARAPFPANRSLSDALDRLVVQESVAPSLCVYEVSELEQQANEALNLAQLKAHQEKSPTRWAHVAEAAGPQIHTTMILRDLAWLQAARESR